MTKHYSARTSSHYHFSNGRCLQPALSLIEVNAYERNLPAHTISEVVWSANTICSESIACELFHVVRSVPCDHGRVPIARETRWVYPRFLDGGHRTGVKIPGIEAARFVEDVNVGGRGGGTENTPQSSPGLWTLYMFSRGFSPRRRRGLNGAIHNVQCNVPACTLYTSVESEEFSLVKCNGVQDEALVIAAYGRTPMRSCSSARDALSVGSTYAETLHGKPTIEIDKRALCTALL